MLDTQGSGGEAGISGIVGSVGTLGWTGVGSRSVHDSKIVHSIIITTVRFQGLFFSS